MSAATREPLPHGRGSVQGAVWFAVAVLALGVVWLVVLPQIGKTPVIREFIDSNESRGINPGAMYYTELEAMPRIIDEIDRTRENARDAFWRPSFRESTGGR